MAKLTDKEFAIAGQAYDEQQERFASRTYDTHIPGRECIKQMTPSQVDAVYDRYYRQGSGA